MSCFTQPSRWPVFPLAWTETGDLDHARLLARSRFANMQYRMPSVGAPLAPALYRTPQSIFSRLILVHLSFLCKQLDASALCLIS